MLGLYLFAAFVTIIALWGIIDMASNYKAGKLFDDMIGYKEREFDDEAGWLWGIIESANARRKRVERALRREKLRRAREIGHLRYELAGALHQAAMFKVEVAALQDRQRKLEDQNQNLAGDLVEVELKQKDREAVRDALCKKIG